MLENSHSKHVKPYLCQTLGECFGYSKTPSYSLQFTIHFNDSILLTNANFETLIIIFN